MRQLKGRNFRLNYLSDQYQLQYQISILKGLQDNQNSKINGQITYKRLSKDDGVNE